MPGIVEFPKLVQDALARYGDLFANECQRRHFAEYLTGLFVAERKTVLGINAEFARDHRPVLPQSLPDRRRLGRPGPQPTTPGGTPEGPVHPLQRPGRHPHRQHPDRPRRDADPRRRLVLGPRRAALQDRPRLPLRQLRLHLGQALPAGVPPLPQGGGLQGPEGAVPQPHQAVLRVDRLGVRAADPRRLRHGQLLHQRRDPQPHPRQAGSARAATGLRRRPEVQPQAGVEGPDHQGQRTGGVDPGGGPQGDADRRQAPVVLHRDGADPRREAQGADRHPVALPPGREVLQGPGDQSGHLGGESDRAGVPASLDGHGDVPSGRQAATRDGRLSAA